MVDVAPYIDKRNATLWKELQNSDISIKVEEENLAFGYGCYCKGDNVIIKVQIANPDPASFAHELLHVKLRKEGMFAGGCLKKMIKENPVLKDIITNETIDVITNCMEHVKMQPQFIAMGYDNSEFLADYNDCKFNIEDYQALYLWYEIERMSAVDRMLGTYCAMRADKNPEHDYGTLYPLLQSIDEELYAVLEKFWDEWLQYDVEKKRTPIEPDYGPIISDFVQSLAKHIEKIIC